MSDIGFAIIGLLVLIGLFVAVEQLMRKRDDDPRHKYEDYKSYESGYSDPGGHSDAGGF